MDINFSELKKATANTQTLNQGLLSGLEKAIQYTQIRNQSFLGSLPNFEKIYNPTPISQLLGISAQISNQSPTLQWLSISQSLEQVGENTQTLNQGLLSGLEKVIQYTQIRNQSFLGNLPNFEKIYNPTPISQLLGISAQISNQSPTLQWLSISQSLEQVGENSILALTQDIFKEWQGNPFPITEKYVTESLAHLQNDFDNEEFLDEEDIEKANEFKETIEDIKNTKSKEFIFLLKMFDNKSVENVIDYIKKFISDNKDIIFSLILAFISMNANKKTNAKIEENKQHIIKTNNSIDDIKKEQNAQSLQLEQIEDKIEQATKETNKKLDSLLIQKVKE